jgi:photosystem II stability/assembly factor-like uncharacterized protein
MACLAASCSGAPATLRGTQRAMRGTADASRSSAEPLGTGPVWQRISPRTLALPIGDVAAMSGDGAIVAAGGSLFRIEHGEVTEICSEMQPAPRVTQANGDRFLALGGTESESFVWRSTDRGRHCERVRVPPLLTREGRGGASDTPRLELEGTNAIAWTHAGAIAVSHDVGATWRRVQDLANLVAVFSARDETLVAAVHIGEAARYAEPVRLFRLQHPDGGTWEPIAVTPERRAPIQAVLEPDGELVLLDALGTIRVAPDGRAHDARREPALRSPEEGVRIAVPAGRARFLVVTNRTLVDVAEGRFDPFAAFEPARRLAVDANDEGVVWLAHPNGLFRGAVGRAGLDAVVSLPRLAGNLAIIAAEGDSLAMVSYGGDVARSHDGGTHWRAVHLDDFTDASDAAFDSRGNLLVVGGSGTEPAPLAVTDGETVVRMTPRERATSGGYARERSGNDWIATPTVHAVGERWILIDHGVFTSDDEGAHWTSRLPVDATATLVSTAFHGASMIGIDADAQLWRSDDACSTVRPMAIATAVRVALQGGLPVRIAWDGERDIALVSRERVFRSTDGGSSWHPTSAGLDVATGFDVCMTPDRRLVVRIAGRDRENGQLMLENRALHRFQPIDDSDAHPAAAIACDGSWIYVASPEGAVSRLDARRAR